MSEDEQINYIKETEYPMQYDNLLIELRKYEVVKNEEKYIYDIIQFLARVYVWENTFPNVLKYRNLIPDYLNCYGNKIIDIYNTLKSMKNFEIAVTKLEELKNNINALFIQ